MNIKSNKLFLKLSQGIQDSQFNEFDINNLIQLEILKVNVIRKKIRNEYIYLFNDVDVDIDSSEDDISGLEWNLNKVWVGYHTNFLIPAIVLGRYIVDGIIDSLSTKYPGERFLICLSVDNGDYKNITVRFHNIRNDGGNILNSNLELYKDNGMYVVYL